MHRTSQILNGRLAAVVATLRYGEEIVVADAGLPLPQGVEILDLALRPGLPRVLDVIDLLRSELVLSEVRIAAEMSHANASVRSQILERFADTELVVEVDHVEGVEARLPHAKLVIQTGETTPYGNVVLVGGLDFFDLSMAEAPGSAGSTA